MEEGGWVVWFRETGVGLTAVVGYVGAGDYVRPRHLQAHSSLPNYRRQPRTSASIQRLVLLQIFGIDWRWIMRRGSAAVAALRSARPFTLETREGPGRA